MKFIFFKIYPSNREIQFFQNNKIYNFQNHLSNKEIQNFHPVKNNWIQCTKIFDYKNHLSNKEIQFFQNDEIYNFHFHLSNKENSSP